MGNYNHSSTKRLKNYFHYMKFLTNHHKLSFHFVVESWHLGLNINPCDGGNFGYGGPWDSEEDVGYRTQSLMNDFLDAVIWKKKVGFVTIARHVDGICTMSKTWELTDKNKSMHDYFSSYPGRTYVTGDGSQDDNHISSDIPDDFDGSTGEWKDPIFGAEGGLAFNWYYSSNGARIVIPGGYKVPYSLAGTDENNDDVHGLGNDFSGNAIQGQGSNDWWHDVGKIGPDCHGGSCAVVGSDHGPNLASGECWGSYAVFVSEDQRSFDCQGKQLSNTMSMCNTEPTIVSK